LDVFLPFCVEFEVVVSSALVIAQRSITAVMIMIAEMPTIIRNKYKFQWLFQTTKYISFPFPFFIFLGIRIGTTK